MPVERHTHSVRSGQTTEGLLKPPIKKYATGTSFEEVRTIPVSGFFSLTTNGEKTMTTPGSLLTDKFVDMAFITQLTGLTDKWFYKLISLGEFPKPIKLGRSSRWLESEVEAWLQQRISESRG